VRNVTISLDDETALWARMEAARHDTSVSRFVGDVLRQQMHDSADYERARQAYGGRSAAAISSGSGAYPRRDALHSR
jgi:plasmid stability protein